LLGRQRRAVSTAVAALSATGGIGGLPDDSTPHAFRISVRRFNRGGRSGVRRPAYCRAHATVGNRAVREALARPDVQAVAARMGVNPNRLTTVVDTLSGVDLRQAGTTARRVNEQLVGGASNVVISTTTIIIILLVVILIVIIAK
jgi:hypothetical protein